MSFFEYPEYTYNANAAMEIVPEIMRLVHPRSVIDIGCGTGIWLSIFEKHGVTDISGVDHPETDLSLLKIGKEKFIPADLTRPFRANRKFDLVVSLEVAEHLPASAADTFIETLVAHGNLILFSAAIPYQGGEGHLNEQWPAYWAEKFNQHDYFIHDSLRFQIWMNSKVEWWYKQNMVFAVNRKANPLSLKESVVIPVVHPQIFEEKSKALQDTLEGKLGVKASFRILLRALGLRMKGNSAHSGVRKS